MFADKLRKSLLQAAIQGQLTEQLPTDGDARDLLKKIRDEKAKLIAAKKIKAEKPLPPVTDDEIPFELPANWCWCRLGEIGNYKKGPFGSSLTKDIFVPKGNDTIKVYEQKNAIQKDASLGVYYISKKYFFEKMSGFEVKPGDIIVSCAGTIGESYIMPPIMEKGIINQALMRMKIFAPMNVEYFLMFFDFVLKQNAKLNSKGSAIKNIPPFEVLKNFLVPLPPLAEQLRIVERLDALLSEVTELEKDERELNLHVKNFPRKMKNSLLQAAIQGWLTEQLPTDGDARDLLKKIRDEKAKLIVAKKIKAEKSLAPVTDDEIPFELPANWCWCRLGEICEHLQRGKSPQYSPIKKYPVVAQKCNQPWGFTMEQAKFIDPDTINSYGEERFLQADDLLWNSTGLGTVGRMAIYDSAKNSYELAVADSHVTVIRLFKNFVIPRFVFSYITSPVIQSKINSMVSGSTKQKELSLQTVRNVIIPLPPLAEQLRIVERLNELLPLCEI